MTASASQLRDYISHHLGATAVLAALSAVLDAQVTGNSLDPVLQSRIDELFEATGISGITEGVSTEELKQALAEIRFHMLLDAKLLSGANRCMAWTHSETEILQAGGAVSAGFADALTHTIVPRLDGLAQRLGSPSGSFLDIGTGVAGLAIEMALRWPLLHVTGIDPWAPSLALARKNATSAGLVHRIHLREQAVEDLSDANAFDLAWIPSAFIPEKVIRAACDHVHRALRPGGWLLFAMMNPGVDPVTRSTVRLRTVLWGGCVIEPERAASLLSHTGFANVRMLPGPPGSLVALVAARRATEPV